MCRACLTCIVLLLAVAAIPLPARADYYSYTDANGTPVITNRLEAVPRKYRAGMRVVKEDKPAAARNGSRPVTTSPGAMPPGPGPAVRAEPVIAPESPAPVRPSQASRVEEYAQRFPWLKPLGIVAGLLAGFVAVARIASHLSSPQFARVLYLGFFLGVFVFAYKSYAESLVERYFTVKARIVSLFRKANARQAEELNLQPQTPPRPEGAGEGE